MSKALSMEIIATKILEIRSKKVMFDFDLATLYGVKTKRLNEQVSRNRKRFPEDFMFQLDEKEAEFLRSQIVTSKTDSLRSQNATSKRGGRRYLPYVFTQEGVAMLSSVLNSDCAIMVNIQIMRAFVKLKELLLTHKDLAIKINALERKYADHDEKISVIFEAIKQLLAPAPVPEKPKIGFHPNI